MSKQYVHTKRGKTLKYDIGHLEKAVKAVQEGMSIRKASSSFGVPKSTIGDRISGKHDINVQHGRPPCIPREVEEKIVESVKMAARRGIGLSRKQLLLRTNVLCKRLKLGDKYPEFKAGKDWWTGVKRRHTDLTIRKPERLGSTRARMMNPEIIARYFDDMGTILDDLSLKEKPHLIWNCDEMGKNFEHDPVRVIAEKGERNVVSRTSSKSSNITIMACVNAEGDKMPPMFIVKGKSSKSLHGFNVSVAPTGTRWYYQKNGWMDDSIGEKWFNDVFLQHCGPERPQLLLLDGHSSHESLGILQRAMEENIHLLALPPHTTHYLQPLDRAVFGPLNKSYNQLCSAFLQESPLHQINKWTFPSMFCTAWETAVNDTNIKSGFRACGVYPFDQAAIPDKAFGPSKPSDVDVPTASSSTEQGQANETEAAAAIGENPSDPLVSGELDSQTLLADIAFPVEDVMAEPAPDNDTPVLDISDPALLFQLIQNGDIFMDAVTDNHGQELVCSPSINPTTPSPDAASVASQIESAFVPPSVGVTRKSPSSKVVKSHRLLTSESILEEKRLLAERKREKERKKTEKKKQVKL